ncbi:MAG: hypothetical protein ACMG6S_22110 [Byssovorax sp.]
MTERATEAQVIIRLDPLWKERLDNLADVASAVLGREVSRAMVARVGLGAWLVTHEGVEARTLVEAIRGGFAPRGRKPKKELYRRIAPVEEVAHEVPRKRVRLRRRRS